MLPEYVTETEPPITVNGALELLPVSELAFPALREPEALVRVIPGVVPPLEVTPSKTRASGVALETFNAEAPVVKTVPLVEVIVPALLLVKRAILPASGVMSRSAKVRSPLGSVLSEKIIEVLPDWVTFVFAKVTGVVLPITLMPTSPGLVIAVGPVTVVAPPAMA